MFRVLEGRKETTLMNKYKCDICLVIITHACISGFYSDSFGFA